jgi:hypothetical protein
MPATTHRSGRVTKLTQLSAIQRAATTTVLKNGVRVSSKA